MYPVDVRSRANSKAVSLSNWTETVLELLNDQIVSGTLLRFDDLLTSPISPYPNWEQGEWKALVEWCHKYNRKVTPLARSWKQGCTMKVEV